MTSTSDSTFYTPSSGSPSSNQSFSTSSSTNVKSYQSDEAITIFGSKLTSFEHSEIHKYKEIYFVGPEAEKIDGTSDDSNNNGFDDNNKYYIFVQNDHIAYRYELLKVLGKGSFGQVFEAYDHKNQEHVALKMVKSDKGCYRQAQKEIKMLEYLNQKDFDDSKNIIRMFDSFVFRNHQCITFELMSMNLYDLLRKDKIRGVDYEFIRTIAHSILLCLDSLYDYNVIHADLKPENIVLRKPDGSDIKIIDFGLAFFESRCCRTQTRFYRAPEVILRLEHWMPIDIWSLGCILAELLIGEPLFPSKDEYEQMAFYIELLGIPPIYVFETSKISLDYFTHMGHPIYCTETVMNNGTVVVGNGKSKKIFGKPGSRNWETALKYRADYLFIDFLKRCLQWDPEKRITPADALNHPWITKRYPQPIPF